MPAVAAALVDAHVHLSFATHGANPAERGSAEIQAIYLRAQADAGSRAPTSARTARSTRRRPCCGPSASRGDALAAASNAARDYLTGA